MLGDEQPQNPLFFLGLDKKNSMKACKWRTGQLRGKPYVRREQSLWKYYHLQPTITVSGLHKRFFFNAEYVPAWLWPHSSVKQGKATDPDFPATSQTGQKNIDIFLIYI